ncbi:hypothetical protein TrST_g644 [Triparma strigata]|uniref:Mechanosensitive ion channel MscS domain-containing protein n=1 Tax=Triparma strigata TaxID=1606541 RepID=A0A9W7EJY2_9STRA|nr:hypothetical protein TrST_g644 [Triparma strigata]
MASWPQSPQQNHPQSLLFAGRLFHGLTSKSKLSVALKSVNHSIHPGDIVIIFCLLFSDKILALVQTMINSTFRKLRKVEAKPYNLSRLKTLSEPLTRFGLLTTLIYSVSLLEIFLKGLSVFPPKLQISSLTSIILYALWSWQILCKYKRKLILNNFRGPKGQAMLYDRILDFLISTILAFFLMETVALKFGVQLKSLFAFGGLSTVVFGLACQGPVTQLVNGLILTLSDKIRPGDEVRFGDEKDKTAGIVISLDWFDLLLRGYDESMVRIPNSEIANKRIHNISRDVRSQVKTTFGIRYRDLNNVENLIDNIKSQIKSDCEKVIADGSRPFWVHWREFEADHVTVVVDVHFDIRPGTTQYYDMRQKVLSCIKIATAKTGVPFAMPARVSLPSDETNYLN